MERYTLQQRNEILIIHYKNEPKFLRKIIMSDEVHYHLGSTRRAIPKIGPKFLRGPARRTLYSRRTKESGWEAQGKYSTGDRRGAKRDPLRGDCGIPRDPPRSLKLLSSGREVLH